MKKGRFSKKETDYMAKHAGTLTPNQMATKMKRDPKSVEQHVKKKLRVGLTGKEEARFTLRERPFWPELVEQFTEGELKKIEYNWIRIIDQFKTDVIPTEEMQVLDLIILDVLASRCLTGNKRTIEELRILDATIVEEQARDDDQINHDYLFRLRGERAGLRVSTDSSNKEYRELQTKKAALLKDMKATREQRVKRLEESTQSLTGWIVHLMNNPEVVLEYGLEMEKMKLAMYSSMKKLSKWHTFEDGMVDQPFLNHQTVGKGD